MILYAQQRGLDEAFDFQILPPQISNYYSDQAIVQQILDRDPWMVGFSCYLWNIDRTLWIAERLKRANPEILIVVGGPEITADNSWVLESGSIDYAAIGEGEQTIAELLSMLRAGGDTGAIVPGLWRASNPQLPLFRKPLANLDEVSSPYLCGILNAADERLLLLETIRGCVFKCKFCYYRKSYDALYFVSQEKVVANLRHAREAGATEVVLLDPTLNQRKDFDDFLRLLARENPDQQFTYFGELRAEGIKPETAKLLREANFTEVEIGLQSVDPLTQTLMDRRNNMKAFERGVAALMDAGIRVKVDLIIGLPGDTRESVRRGFDYLAATKLFTSMQVFNLAILPGTAFRQEAQDLGLNYQPRPPYYVLETPTLKTEHLFELMAEAQEVFSSEWDPFPEPKLEFEPEGDLVECVRIQLDDAMLESDLLPPANRRAQAMTLVFESSNLNSHAAAMQSIVKQLLQECPHSSLQVVLQPTHDANQLDSSCIDQILAACYQYPNYLDRYYSLNPHGLLGSKRVVVQLSETSQPTDEWLDEIEESATIILQD